MANFGAALSALRDECNPDQLGLINSLDKFYRDAAGEISRLDKLYRSKASESAELQDVCTLKDQQIASMASKIARMQADHALLLDEWSKLNAILETELVRRCNNKENTNVQSAG